MFHDIFPDLGRYSGAGEASNRGFRWRGWPNSYQNTGAQLDANDHCKRIVIKLNENDRNNWTKREVEAVLFMEGY